MSLDMKAISRELVRFGDLIPSNPPTTKKKVTNIYFDPSDGQIKYEVEP